jgi:ribosome-binding factor A
MTRRPDSPRSRRVADRIQVELAEMLQREARDPRLKVLSVTSVEVTRDLASARVWVAGRVPEGEEAGVLHALEHATPYLRTLLAPRLGLRVVPTLQFRFDRSLETGDRIERLLRGLQDPPADDTE